ncbi:MAG TPA: hypothetical protein VH370_24955 [Humisphaera sp.]|jgi:hypothetical protein|nr:hypothetical protein [Humisphaera sp.]
MQTMRWVMVIAVGLVCGCQQKPPPPAPEPATTPQMAAAVRQNILQQDPMAKVGEVKEVYAERNLAAVGDVDVKEFAVGQVIVFVSGNLSPIASGQIIQIANDAGLLVVKYSVTKRAPVKGDLAAKMSERPQLPPGAHVEPSPDAK